VAQLLVHGADYTSLGLVGPCNDGSYVSCTGGYIVISHPLGRRWLNETLHSKDPVMVPHLLPDQEQLEALIADLPLQIHSYLEEDQLYIATLQVMPSPTSLPRSVDALLTLAISCLSFAASDVNSAVHQAICGRVVFPFVHQELHAMQSTCW
jgi:hypothetical protein